jgi:hypothetical protein
MSDRVGYSPLAIHRVRNSKRRDGLPMASSSKKKTTFAKLNREQKLRERREIKEARKAQRKLEASMPPAAPVVDEPQPDEER